MTPSSRPKLLRVVTIHECVLWHLGKTLDELTKHFDVTVAGEGVSRYAQRYPTIKWTDIDIPRKAQPMRDLKSLFQIYILCRRLRPDIVHSIMPKAGLITALAARAAGVRVRIHTFTGQVWDTKSGWIRSAYKMVDHLIVSLNTICLTDSPSQSRHLLVNGIDIQGEPLPVLGKGSLVGVDLERFDPERIRASAQVTRATLGFLPSQFVVAFVARKSRDKGALDMLQAFSQARAGSTDMWLLFIGPDESAGEIERLRKTKPHIFDGVIERDTVFNHEEYLLASDVLCLPSYREGFGSVVIDAASLGVPCVGSKIAGLVDSVADGETGLLHAAGDIAHLAEILSTLNQDREKLKKLGEHARSRVLAFFSTEVVGGLLVKFYQSQMGDGNHSR